MVCRSILPLPPDPGKCSYPVTFLHAARMATTKNLQKRVFKPLAVVFYDKLWLKSVLLEASLHYLP